MANESVLFDTKNCTESENCKNINVEQIDQLIGDSIKLIFAPKEICENLTVEF